MTKLTNYPLLQPEMVDDETERDDIEPEVSYQITSYGTDFDVDGIVKRVKRGSLITPSFQRNYVWTIKDASSFIESLLLGLPVPGVFLARENEEGKFLIIDGQQRIKTLFFFFEGIFKVDEPGNRDKKEFILTGVRKDFLGKSYRTLSEADRNRLNDFPIHATVIKQDSPNDGDTSIYHIFDRLNSRGRKLTAQEIRSAVAHGRFMELLSILNNNRNWRHIFGNKSSRLKDQEMILRFLAMFYNFEGYEAPMSEFLNIFANKHRNDSEANLLVFKNNFEETIETVYEAVGSSAFKLTNSLNAAVFDSVMVSVSRLSPKKKNNLEGIRTAYEELLGDPDYRISVSRATANAANLKTRFEIAERYFGSVNE